MSENKESQEQSDKNESEQFNADQFYQRIKQQVKAEIEANGEASVLKFTKKDADFSGKSAQAGELIYSDQLRYLNLNHGIAKEPDLSGIRTHRKGFTGKLITKLKTQLLRTTWSLLSDRHFRKEEEFRSNLVQFLNNNAKYVDLRDADNFWQLIHKIDFDNSKITELFCSTRDELSADLYNTQRDLNKNLSEQVVKLQELINQNQIMIEQQAERISALESVTSGLEGIIARSSQSEAKGSAYAGQRDRKLSNKAESAAEPGPAKPEGLDAQPTDYSYLLLENRFRGSEAAISERLQIYPEYFKNCGAGQPVIEIGCGRGELLDLFAAQNLSARGIDLDRAMIEVCQEKNHDVVLADALSAISGYAENSVGGVIAVQVIEHLERGYFETLLAQIEQKLVPGGKVIFETINPQSLLALSSNYFRDPTHVWPMHPDTVKYQLELAGYQQATVRYLSPVKGLLQKIEVEDQLPAQWLSATKTINQNFAQINQLIYGYMDYAIIAQKAGGSLAETERAQS